MASELRVDKIIPSSGTSIGIGTASGTINILGNSQINTTGVITATSFVASGTITGEHHGNGANLTNIPAANLTGTIADARISTLTASKLSGALPALDGSALTGVGVGTADSINTSGIITATSLVQNSAFSHRNKIYNGDMRIAQRGDAHTNVGSSANTYTLDRWKLYVQNSSARFQIERNYDHSLPDGFLTSMRISCTTTDTSLAATDEVYLQQSLEGNDVFEFAKGTPSAKQYTLSFYARSDKTGTYIVRLLGRDNTTSNCSAAYTVTNTWTRYVITFPADTSSNRKDNPDNGEALRVMWYLVAGSGINNGTLQTTWANSSDTGAATGQVNFADNNSNRDFYLTGCQLEVGPVATPFEHIPYTEQLTRCERYYQKYGDQRQMWMTNVNGTDHRKVISFPTSMRTAPTMNLYDQSVDGSSVSAQYVNTKGYVCRLNGNGRHAAWKHEADAEF